MLPQPLQYSHTRFRSEVCMSRFTLPVLWLLSVFGDVQCSSAVYKAVKDYHDPELFFRQEPAGYDKTRFTPEDIRRLSRKNTEEAEKILDSCVKSGIRVITYYDPDYPESLRKIDQPPAALFVKGELPDFSRTPSVSVVGTRECSDFGGRFAASLSYALAHSGFVIVSGMARGIDTFAHKGALLAGKKTVAVLPCGADMAYPKQNRELYDRITASGAVISEYLPGTECRAYHFRMRNRVISALSHSLVVVESGSGGGSMITVGHAVEQGKTVFAVPGSPGVRTSAGTNTLIGSGAMICLGPKDIIDEYNACNGTDIKLFIPERKKAAAAEKEPPGKTKSKKEAKAQDGGISGETGIIRSGTEKCAEDPEKPVKTPDTADFTPEQRDVYELLRQGAVCADDVCQALGMTFPKAINILGSFELLGYAKAMPGGYYSIH